MEEKLGQSDPEAGMVPLGMRVDKAMKCHQGSLYAQGGVQCHAEKGKQRHGQRDGSPRPGGGVQLVWGKVSTESLSSLGSAGSQFSLHVCTIMPPPPDHLPLFFQ